MNESKKKKMHGSYLELCEFTADKEKNSIATITWEEKVSWGLIEIGDYYQTGYLESQREQLFDWGVTWEFYLLSS